MPAPNSCTVSLRDLDGVTHIVRVQATSLDEPAAKAVAAFTGQGRAADAPTPNATLRVEVQLPPIVHDVPLKAAEKWLRSPTISPKRQTVKKAAQTAPRRPTADGRWR